MIRYSDEMEVQAIMREIIREMQKDLISKEFWLDDKKDKLPLLMGIWEFKEDASEMGFTIGLS